MGLSSQIQAHLKKQGPNDITGSDFGDKRALNTVDLSNSSFSPPQNCTYIERTSTSLSESFFFYTDNTKTTLIKTVEINYADTSFNNLVSVRWF